jgi:hypothetical protein
MKKSLMYERQILLGNKIDLIESFEREYILRNALNCYQNQ